MNALRKKVKKEPLKKHSSVAVSSPSAHRTKSRKERLKRSSDIFGRFGIKEKAKTASKFGTWRHSTFHNNAGNLKTKPLSGGIGDDDDEEDGEEGGLESGGGRRRGVTISSVGGAPKNVMESIPPRDKIVFEILSTEETYSEHLQCLVDVYMPGLRNLTSPDEFKAIFSNAVVINNFSKAFLKVLSERIENWDSEPENPSTLSDIFLKYWPFFKAYQQYYNQFDESVETVAQCSSRSAFSSFCKEQITKAPGGVGPDLRSLLVNPIQRLPRYVMLLTTLASHTSKDHPDFSGIEEAREKLKELTDTLNSGIKTNDLSKVFLGVVEKVEGITDHVTPTRRLLAHYKDRSAGFWILLFTDILFTATPVSPSDDRSVDLKTHLDDDTSDSWSIRDMLPFEQVWFDGDSFRLILPRIPGTPQCSILVDTPFKQVAEKIIPTKRNREFDFEGPKDEKYSGEWKDGLAHGKGVFFPQKSNESLKYTGYFRAGQFTKGTYKFGYADRHDRTFVGTFKNGLMHGTGRLMEPHASYFGNWRNGLKSGKGRLEWNSGDVYDGNFKNDRFHGKGHYTSEQSNSRYCGEWRRGFRHGKGKQVCTVLLKKTMGDPEVVQFVYRGEWRKDFRSGQGTFSVTRVQGPALSPNPTSCPLSPQLLMLPVGLSNSTSNTVWKYTGEWKENRFHGKGLLVGPQFACEAAWHFGKQDPQTASLVSTFVDMQDRTYRLNYRGGLRDTTLKHGNGTLEIHRDGKTVEEEDPSGSSRLLSYQGGWLNDRRSGEGIQTDRLGTLKCSFSEDQRNGRNMESKEKGVWSDCEWKKDQPQHERKENTQKRKAKRNHVSNSGLLRPPIIPPTKLNLI